MSYFFFLIGPAASGKSSVAKKIKKKLNFNHVEGDNFHSLKNINLMKKGIKLKSSDRYPWLNKINKNLKSHTKSNTNFIISCSALKKRYRNILSKNLKNTYFFYLRCKKSVLTKRVKSRKHFFPLSLLNDQVLSFETSKDLFIVNSNNNISKVVTKISKKIGNIMKSNKP